MLGAWNILDATDDCPAADPWRFTASDPLGGTTPIYPHGFDVRLRLVVPDERATEALGRCGWSPSADARQWTALRRKNGTRSWTMRGSAWLTGRAPKNKLLPLARANKLWKTRLYGIAVEQSAAGFCLDVKGVRFGDVARFIGDVLGLSSGEIAIAHLRQAESYIVLGPGDASRVARALGGRRCWGSGRLAGKEFLLREQAIPVVVKARSRMEAMLSIYRVGRGATALYRCEVGLSGRRRDRTTFGPADVERLHRILQGLVRDHDLRPFAKPARWEPRNFAAPVEREPFAPEIRELPRAAYAGARPPPAVLDEAAKCHTPRSLALAHFPYENKANERHDPPETLVMTDQTPSTHLVEEKVPTKEDTTGNMKFESIDDAFGVRMYGKIPSVNRPSLHLRHGPAGAWKCVVEEIGSLPGGMLSEVILDAEQDEGPLLRALGEKLGAKLGVAYFGPAGFESYSTLEAAREHPADGPDVEHLVFVTSPEIVQAFHQHWPAAGEPEPRIEPDHVQAEIVASLLDDVPLPPRPARPVGPRDPDDELAGKARIIMDHLRQVGGEHRDVLRAQFRRVGAGLWEVLAGWRRLAEEEDINITLVTTDARLSDQPVQSDRAAFFTDSRVRSSLGDAGRHHCDHRLRVELGEDGGSHRVVVIRDGVEGLVGRILFARPAIG